MTHFGQRTQQGRTRTAVLRIPAGWIGIEQTDKGISRIVLPRSDRKAVWRELRHAGQASRFSEKGKSPPSEILARAVTMVRTYFSGTPVLFDLPLDLRYYTPFQRAVWKAASGIPHGETRSYGWIAKRIRRPKAARAVGQAMGANPVPLLVP